MYGKKREDGNLGAVAGITAAANTSTHGFGQKGTVGGNRSKRTLK